MRDKHLQVQVASDLNGLALNLPAPLGKPAGQDMPLRFDLRPSPNRAGLDDVTLQLGNNASARYVVRRGDTLASIARTFHTSVATLKADNKMRSTKLRVGQRLTIRTQDDEIATR